MNNPDGLVITDAAGALLDPASLCYFVDELGEERAGELFALATRRGQLVARDGVTVACLGVAARLSLTVGYGDGGPFAVMGALRAIAPEIGSEDPHGPLAIGALPFTSRAASSLIVPELTLLIGEKGPARLIAVAIPARLAALRNEFPFVAGREEFAEQLLPDQFELISARSHQAFTESVRDALGAIAAGQFEKVVLAREVLVRANRPLVRHDLLGRLRALYPSCATFGIDGFIGASPELLCRREGRLVHAQPLAGTVPRSGDPEQDARLAEALLSSPKERAEHQFVVDAIAETLASYAASISVPPTPHLFEMRNVVHLATMITAELMPGQPGTPLPSALELAVALHPTPAVGGVPTTAALGYLATHEFLERDYYAGPVGYVHADGDGEFWIGIRSAMINGNEARLLAGVGIVAGSDPNAELAETQLKLQALLAATVRP